jgi:lysozyme family protein
MWQELKAIVLNKPEVTPAPPPGQKEPVRRWHPPTDYFTKMVVDQEGGYQDHEEDRMNWVGKRLVGTKYGITAYSLAEYRNCKPEEIFAKDILSLDSREAALIGFKLYYLNPGFAKLDWGPTTEALTDHGFMSGQGLATRHLQELIGVAEDGLLGPRSYAAYREWVESNGWAKCSDLLAARRKKYYDEIVKKRPTQSKFIKGWKVRADSFRSNNTEWWEPNWRVAPTVTRGA